MVIENVTKNQSVLDWVKDKIELVQPDKVVLIDGSQEQIDALRAEACSTGEMIKLNQEKLPDCYLHRTAVNDVARVEGRTFICSREEKNAGPTNNWMDPEKAYKMLYDIARNSYKGRTMYIIPYSMGPIGSPLSKVGIELTDSIYVVLNMCIMTRVSTKVFDVLGDSNDWVRGLHCKCEINEEKRYICQFPEDNTIISVNSGYGGNVLLGKKCFALRIASYQGWKEGWQAEHMLILGIENPQHEVKYICAAFPSACGKTNLAMLIPPETYLKKGYKVWCVGDDISWIRKGADGRLYAINPENGKAVGIPVPLANLVYHDCVLIPWNWFNNWGIPKGDNGDLYCALNAGMPYINPFGTGVRKIGSDSRGAELELLDESKLKEDIARVKPLMQLQLQNPARKNCRPESVFPVCAPAPLQRKAAVSDRQKNWRRFA